MCIVFCFWSPSSRQYSSSGSFNEAMFVAFLKLLKTAGAQREQKDYVLIDVSVTAFIMSLFIFLHRPAFLQILEIFNGINHFRDSQNFKPLWSGTYKNSSIAKTGNMPSNRQKFLLFPHAQWSKKYSQKICQPFLWCKRPSNKSCAESFSHSI